jgi:hypothetical protein
MTSVLMSEFEIGVKSIFILARAELQGHDYFLGTLKSLDNVF